MAATHLRHFFKDVLYPSRFVNCELGAEDTVSKAELPLTIVTEGVELACCRDESRRQVSTFNLRDRMGSFKIQSLWPEEASRLGVLPALPLCVSSPSEDCILLCEYHSVVAATGDFTPQLPRLKQA